VNGPTTSTGKFAAGAATFSVGAASGITVPSQSISGDIAISGWVNEAWSTPQFGPIYAANFSSSTGISFSPKVPSTFQDWLAGDSVLAGYGYGLHLPSDLGNTPRFVSSGTPAMADGTWHYFVGVLDGAGDVAQTYVDGVALNPRIFALVTSTVSYPGTPPSIATSGVIGFDPATGDKSNMTLQEVRVSNISSYNPVVTATSDLSSIDDSFPGTTLNPKWTWVNQAGATSSVSNGHLLLTSDSNPKSHAFYEYIEETAPSSSATSSWEVTLQNSSTFTAADNFGSALILADNSGHFLAWGYAQDGTPSFMLCYILNPFLWIESPYTFDTPITSAYFRIINNFDSYFTFQYSTDTVNWTTAISLPVGDFLTSDVTQADV
jgi:hypothetical protein